MMSASETRNARTELLTTDVPQSGPIVVTSNPSVLHPNVSATSFATAVASSADVVAVRARNPSSPSDVVVWMTASGSPASAKASRTCSMVTSPVLWKAMDVPPTNSIPKLMPRTPTITAIATTTTAAAVRKYLRRPRMRNRA